MSTELNQEMSELVKRYLPGAMAGEMLTFLKEADSLKIELKQTKKELEKAKEELVELKSLKLNQTVINQDKKRLEAYQKKLDKMDVDLQDRLRKYEMDLDVLKLKAKYEANLESQNELKTIVATMFTNSNIVNNKK